jgi:hypothetical protein
MTAKAIYDAMTDNDWVSSFPDYKARKAAADARRKPATEADPEILPPLKLSANPKGVQTVFLLQGSVLFLVFVVGVAVGVSFGTMYTINAYRSNPHSTTTKAP